MGEDSNLKCRINKGTFGPSQNGNINTLPYVPASVSDFFTFSLSSNPDLKNVTLHQYSSSICNPQIYSTQFSPTEMSTAFQGVQWSVKGCILSHLQQSLKADITLKPLSVKNIN